MPARQRRLTPSTEIAPGRRRIAATISASGTVSQRQTICPPRGIGLNEFFLARKRRAVKVVRRAANWVPVSPLVQFHARLTHHKLHVLGNGRRACHTRRLNARRLEKPRHHGRLSNKEVVRSLNDRTPAGKRAHHAARIQIGHQLARAAQQRVHIARIGLRVARLAHGGRRGDHGVAVHGARHDNALRHRRRHGVERHERARLLVQHHDVALTPDHLELLGARHMRDVGGAVARGVDQVTAAHVASGRRQRKARVVARARNFNRLHGCGAHKRHPVGHGVLQRGDGNLKRVDKPSRGAPQRARCRGTGARLKFVDALGADNRQLGHAVRQAVAA